MDHISYRKLNKAAFQSSAGPSPQYSTPISTAETPGSDLKSLNAGSLSDIEITPVSDQQNLRMFNSDRALGSQARPEGRKLETQLFSECHAQGLERTKKRLGATVDQISEIRRRFRETVNSPSTIPSATTIPLVEEYNPRREGSKQAFENTELNESGCECGVIGLAAGTRRSSDKKLTYSTCTQKDTSGCHNLGEILQKSETLRSLAWFMEQELNDPNCALKLFEQALNLRKDYNLDHCVDHGRILFEYGSVLFKIGRTEESRDVLYLAEKLGFGFVSPKCLTTCQQRESSKRG